MISQDRRGRRGLRWAAAVVIVVSAGLLSACSDHDERAYSYDSGDMSLENGVKLYGLIMPDCPYDDVHYALVGDWGHDIYLSFSASSECMLSFLRVNAMEGGEPAGAPGAYFQLAAKTDEVGWSFPIDHSYVSYHGNRTGGRPLEIIVDTTADKQVLYLFGFPV
ncbi:hypothetical protein AB0M47_39290 [Hamadaea sp. NPDC051192]|uniref:hypothetical protein n=1 Tax=Hamadaea sp. NPDC051192 TaxID=3154940 RepID=UPI003430D87B